MIVAFFCYCVVISLYVPVTSRDHFCMFLIIPFSGEMASYIPVSGSFATFATRFVSPALGFTLGTS